MLSYELQYFSYYMQNYVLKCLLLFCIDLPTSLDEGTFPAITLLTLCSLFRFIERSGKSFVFVALFF